MHWTLQMHIGPQRINNKAVAVGTNIFSFGGYSNFVDYIFKKPIDLHVLDTVKLKWLIPELKDQNPNCVPCQRFGHTVVAFGSNIYLWGGCNIITNCNTLYCFDTSTLKWSKPHVKGNIPAGRDCHSACVIKNCMYIFGGNIESNEFDSKLYMFNFETMMWSIVLTTGFGPSVRYFHTATAIGNKMYIYGGSDDWHAQEEADADDNTSLMFCLDTSTNTWTCPQTSGDSPISRCSHSAFVYNGFIYIFGGYNIMNKIHLNDINRYDPVGCTWKKILPIGIPPCPRKKQICHIINNKVFISGGNSPRSSNFPIRTIEVFDEAASDFLKHHNDLHVLDMNPSLKDMCMVAVWKRLIEVNADYIDGLCIPLSLKHELDTFNPTKSIENDDN